VTVSSRQINDTSIRDLAASNERPATMEGKTGFEPATFTLAGCLSPSTVSWWVL
jgi:hypothetical protein